MKIKVNNYITLEPNANSILVSIIILFILDLVNLAFLRYYGMNYLFASEQFQNIITQSFQLQGISLDKSLMHDVIAVYYTTFLLMSYFFVFFNIFFYWQSYREKRWALKYSRALAFFGLLFTLSSFLSSPLSLVGLLNLIQVVTYLYVFVLLIKIIRQSEGKKYLQNRAGPN